MIRTFLGIDAAWTATEPSGIALVQRSGSIWRCLAVAPSYSAFVALRDGTSVDWSARPIGSAPDIGALLAVARTLSVSNIDLVTIDMPVSTVSITGRREAEKFVSRKFGGRHCAAHSPGPDRPGPLGAAITRAFLNEDFAIATTATTPGAANHLLEVYPHPALLALLNRPTRVPYKQSRSLTYWPGTSVRQRIANLMVEYRSICDALRHEFGELPFSLPETDAVTTLSDLKRYEDALDAMICCWVGVLYASKRATPLGDATAAIWCPTASLDPAEATAGR